MSQKTASEYRHLLDSVREASGMHEMDAGGYFAVKTFRWNSDSTRKTIDIEAVEVIEPKGLLPEKT